MGRGRHRLRAALVVAEVTLALVLLIGAGLLVRSFQGLLSVNESYSPETLLTMNLTLPDTQYGKASERLSFHEQVQQRLAAIPGVQTAALVSRVPYADGGGISTRDFSVEGRPLTRRDESRDAIVETTSPSYFGELNIGLRDGRVLTDADGAETARVAVVSASLVTALFWGRESAGQTHKNRQGRLG